jgi:hypothetical protein
VRYIRSGMWTVRFAERVELQGPCAPVAALYEQGKVRHVGHWTELERQYCRFSTGGDARAGSPDRADAAISALTELMLDAEPQPNVRFFDLSGSVGVSRVLTRNRNEHLLLFSMQSVRRRSRRSRWRPLEGWLSRSAFLGAIQPGKLRVQNRYGVGRGFRERRTARDACR